MVYQESDLQSVVEIAQFTWNLTWFTVADLLKNKELLRYFLMEGMLHVISN